MLFIVDVDNEGFKVYDSGGTLIDPAKEGTLNDVKTLLTGIRDTAGIKKITDALPTGNNWIGRVKIGDGTNLVAIIDDNGVYSLATSNAFVRDRDKLVSANYAEAGLSATNYYILIDLDSVVYPHGAGTRVLISAITGDAVKSNSGSKWAVKIGVIMTIDGTSAKIGWLPAASISLADTSRLGSEVKAVLFPTYTDLAQTGGVFDKIATKQYDTGITAVNTGITLVDALGNSVTPAVGDVLVEAKIISGAGTLGFKYSMTYWVE